MVPRRGTETFISTIGHLDGRLDLYKGRELVRANIVNGDSIHRESIFKPEMGSKALMDLCIMASKLAYENAKVIKRVVDHHWKVSYKFRT